jgi:hypothetical protein
MKRVILGLAAIMLLTLSGWAEQLTPGEQARASVSAHRQEAQGNQGHRRRGRHHRRHFRRHHGS